MIWPAFVIGLAGSMHCLGMCGPIALALPIPADTNRYGGIALYTFGRIITYGFLGLLFGSFGSLFALAGLQQGLSIAAGVAMLLLVLFPMLKNNRLFRLNGFSRLLTPLKIALSVHLKKHSLFSLFAIGILNGLLPCGLVYVAVIAAVATGTTFGGAFFMMLFGLGTAPAMFLLSVFGNSISQPLRTKLSKGLPYAAGMLGILLVLRGLNLGIPYVSPVLSSGHLKATQCCTQAKCP